VPTGASMARLSWTAASDDIGVTGYAIYRDGLPVLSVGAVLSADVSGLDTSATQAFQVQAFDAAGNVSAGGPTPTLHIGTPAPGLVAPPVDTSVAATVLDAFSFLFAADNPIQTGANPETFDRQRACLVRGQVSDASGAPLQDVAITVLNHSEFGNT